MNSKTDMQELGADASLFVLSFRNRDELAQAVARGGWHAIAARRGENAEARFLASGAMVAVVDMRGAREQGLSAVGALADAVEVNSAALLAILSKADLARLDDIVKAGATHYLTAPFSDDEFVQAVRLAERHAQRVAGGRSGQVRGSKPASKAMPVATRSNRDPLTGLRDSASARRWIERRIEAGTGRFHVVLIAITRFEMINTAFGRETGDQLLLNAARQIASLVAENGGKRALVARTTGAEFIIGLDGSIEPERATLLAEGLVDLLERPMLAGSHLVTLSTRLAVVEGGSDNRDAASVLRLASAVLAEAKSGEQTRIRIVGREGQVAAAFDETLQSDLRNALDRDEIEILFQPQVSVPTGKIVGVEALARWKHPRHGELGAVTLFAAAEHSDYLLPLSAHVQKRALDKAAAWPETLSRLRLSVNVTASDVAKPGFSGSFLAMVDESGFPRERLTVEVTETGLMADLGAAATLLAELRAGGCRVAIDDFGTGYSSLAYLKALPLDYLKVDKKLAEDITGSTRDRIVVRGVIDMARSLGLAVIAEGVETEEQLALLAREGCNYYQGFLCAEPVDTSELVALIKSR
jgi:diguanylate cyclase (GGDEF)-like protein